MKNKNKKKWITNLNEKGQYHGYQQTYDDDGKLGVRINCKYNLNIGYEEWHSKRTTFYIR